MTLVHLLPQRRDCRVVPVGMGKSCAASARSRLNCLGRGTTCLETAAVGVSCRVGGYRLYGGLVVVAGRVMMDSALGLESFFKLVISNQIISNVIKATRKAKKHTDKPKKTKLIPEKNTKKRTRTSSVNQTTGTTDNTTTINTNWDEVSR